MQRCIDQHDMAIQAARSRHTRGLQPAQIKVLVVYLCMGLVSLILGTIAVRAVVAFATWLVAGRALWLLPNALSDVRRPGACLCRHDCHHGGTAWLLIMHLWVLISLNIAVDPSQSAWYPASGTPVGLMNSVAAPRGTAAFRRFVMPTCKCERTVCSTLASYHQRCPMQEVGLDQAFWPLWELEEVGEDWWWGSNILMRLGLLATSALALWGLATVSPGKGASLAARG